MSTVKVVILIALTMLMTPQLAMGVITFDQLSQDTFLVTHRVKIFGGRGQALRKAYEKAASLCVAAGYEYLKIQNQESQSYQPEEAANAGIQVRFFFDPGEERLDCRELATGEYIEQAAIKLDRRGYLAPERPSVDEAEDGALSCTPEQIAAMVKLNLSERQIKAACGL